MNHLLQQLTTPDTYVNEIQKMHDKLSARQSLFSDRQEGVLFYSFSLQRNQIAKLLAKSISREEFQFDVGHEKILRIGSKKQAMIQQTILDRIVQGAIFTQLSSFAETLYSEALTSYRKGCSVYTTANSIRTCFKSHRSKHTNNKVDLYILRSDIQSYANTVPLDNQSPLWEMLKGLLLSIDPDNPATDYLHQLIRQSINPTFINRDGIKQRNDIGLPYGSKMAGFIYNFYINSVDHKIAKIPGIFYQRYCDDIFICHENREKVLEAGQIFSDSLSEHGLTVNSAKNKWMYLTLAGRACTADPQFKGSTNLDFLGFSIQADGTIRLKKRHTRKFMKTLHRRIQAAGYLTRNDSLDDRGQAVCQAVRNSLSRNHCVSLPKYISMIEFNDDRQQLKQLDHQIALWASQAITGINNMATLRKVPPKMMKNRWGLPSLCHLRNKGAGH